MRDTVHFAKPLSVVTLFTLLPLTNAVAQDERIRQIDRRVLDPAPAVVAEADISPPPVELSETAKLQFLEQVVSQTPPMQASGSFTGLRADLLAKLVGLFPVFRLTPKNPYVSQVINDMNVVAGLRFHSPTFVTPYGDQPNGHVKFYGGIMVLGDVSHLAGVGNSHLSVRFLAGLPLNALYLLDFSLGIVGDSGVGEFQLDAADSTVCRIDFLHAPKEFTLQNGSHHVLAIVERLTPGHCDLRLRVLNPGSWYFFSLQVTEP